MGVYLRILRAPRVFVLVSAVLLGRLPFAINALAVLLFVREITGSFAEAGIVAGGLALGSAFGAPLQGRFVDRRGEGMLLALAGVHAAAILSIWALGDAGAGVPVLTVLAAVAGIAFPPTGSVLRSCWPQLLGQRPRLVSAAYAFDSVMIEVAFVTGPLLTALGVALAGPEAMLGVSAALNLIGTSVFVAVIPGRSSRAQADGSPWGWGALASPAIRTMALATLPVGFCIGCIEVAVPAFSAEQGETHLAGVLLALWSLGSAAGGLVLGARERRSELIDVHARLALVLPLAMLPLLAAGSPLAMALLVPLAGIPIAPLIATRNELVSRFAPVGAITEAFTWPLTALVGGLSLGTAGGGALVEMGDWTAAVIAGAAISSLGGLLVLSRRESLAPATA